MRSLILACTAIATVAAISALPARAQDGYTDHVYADSMGNLIVDSAAGYKRIIVGQGDRARELADYTQAGQPKIIRVQDELYDCAIRNNRPYGSQQSLNACN